MATPGFQRFKYSKQGYLTILRSAEVAAVLEDKANRAALVVDAAYDDPDWDVVADVQVGRNRAVAIVSGVPMRIEERDRILLAGIEAAR